MFTNFRCFLRLFFASNPLIFYLIRKRNVKAAEAIECIDPNRISMHVETHREYWWRENYGIFRVEMCEYVIMHSQHHTTDGQKKTTKNSYTHTRLTPLQTIIAQRCNYSAKIQNERTKWNKELFETHFAFTYIEFALIYSCDNELACKVKITLNIAE